MSMHELWCLETWLLLYCIEINSRCFKESCKRIVQCQINTPPNNRGNTHFLLLKLHCCLRYLTVCKTHLYAMSSLLGAFMQIIAKWGKYFHYIISIQHTSFAILHSFSPLPLQNTHNWQVTHCCTCKTWLVILLITCDIQIHWLIDWLIEYGFMPYQQYFSQRQYFYNGLDWKNIRVY